MRKVVTSKKQKKSATKSLKEHFPFSSKELKDPSGKALNCRDAATYRNLWSFHLYNRLQEIVFEAGDSDRDPNVEPQPAPSGFAESGEGNSSAG